MPHKGRVVHFRPMSHCGTYDRGPLLAGENLGLTNKQPMADLRDRNYIFHAHDSANLRPNFCGQGRFP